MAGSMLDSILAMVTPEMSQALATRLGEAPQAVQSGLRMATAATLAGLAKQAGDTNFLGQIINMAGTTSGQNILGDLSSLAASGPSGAVASLANRFLPIVFAGGLEQVSGLLSQKVGLCAASMNGLLRIAAALVIGFLGKLHGSGSLGVGALAGMLRSESLHLEKYVPADLFSAATPGASREDSVVGGRREPKKSALWLVVLGVLAAILLSWLVYRALERGKGAVTNSSRAAHGEFLKLKGQDGTKLTVPQ